jgi:phosphatidylserine decarboxylase precursor
MQQFFTRIHNDRVQGERSDLIVHSKVVADVVSPADGVVFAIGELDLDCLLSDVRLASPVQDLNVDGDGDGDEDCTDRFALAKRPRSIQMEVASGGPRVVGDATDSRPTPSRSDELLTIKGVKIPLAELLDLPREHLIERLSNIINKTDNRSLYYCSVYLRPGSYHRFHSPIDGFRICEERHISGSLLPVATWFMRRFPCTPAINERVALIGRWAHGFFSLVPVGATNVGSIVINESARPVASTGAAAVEMGDELGRFELGSLVVMLFEGPSNAHWHVAPDLAVRYGDPVVSFV